MLKGIFESDLQAGIVVSVAKLGFSFVAIIYINETRMEIIRTQLVPTWREKYDYVASSI
jgi:hypothetical protein